MPKRILRNLKLNAIAAVDRPCQEGAKAMILKRADDPAKGNGIDEDDDPASFPKKRRKDDDYTGAKNVDEEVKKQLDAAKATLTAIAKAFELDPDSATFGDDLAKALQKRDVELEVAKQIAGLSWVQKSHYDELAKADEKRAGEFLKMSDADRDAAIKLAKADDETFEYAGRTISKRAVGEDTFAVMKAQAEELAKQKERTDKAEESALQTRLEKRAEDDMSHLAGGEGHVGILKHMESAPDDVKKAFGEMIKAADKMSSSAFTRAGHGDAQPNPTVQKARTDFNKRLAEVRKEFPEKPAHECMSIARKRFPDEAAAAFSNGKEE